MSPRSMTPGLNDEQRRAVDRREGTMLLAAGAGSGKTTVLVERFVADVMESRALGEDERIPVDGILAITFTRLAAAELTDRIRKLFIERDQPGLASEVEGAWVMTFDAYCASLLREEAALAGLDPGFAVIDEAQELLLREEAWVSALAGVLADPQTRDGIVATLVSTDEERLRDEVARFHRSRRSAGDPVPGLPEPPEPDVAGAAEALLTAAAAFAPVLEGGGDSKTVVAALEAVGRCIGDLASPVEEIDAAQVRLWRSSRSTAKVFKTPESEAYYGRLADFGQAFAEVRMGPRVEAVRALVHAYGSDYERLKSAAGGLDFADLAIRAAALLEEHPAVAAEQRRRFRRVLVDEFQDTNALQVRLLETLAVEDLFMVGDDLQAIYGFRDADVEIFRERLRFHLEAGEAERLKLNYRSITELLAFINAGLGSLHGEAYAPLLPDSEAGPVRVGLPDAPEDAAVELVLVDEEWNRAESLAGTLTDRFPAGTRTAQAVEALFVAERLAAMVDAKECKPGDIAVLVRAAASIEPFVRALSRAGVPAVAGSLRGWWSQPEVADLVAYLRLLANPEDDQALYETLCSPVVGAGSDTLVLLARHRRLNGGSMQEAFEGAARGEVEGIAPADAGRLGAFGSLIAEERAEAPWVPPSTLLERVIARTGFDAAVAAGPQGPEALLRMRRLVRLAHEFEEREGSDLRRFVDHVALHRDEDTRMTEAPPGEAAEAATVMTMHAAKGLQFPVVVVGGLGRAPAGGGTSLLSDGARVGLKLKDEAGDAHELFAFDELVEEDKRRRMDEECRLLHVAATRAERRLILSGTVRVRSNSDTWTDEQTVGRAPILWAGRSILGGNELEQKDAFAELDEQVVAVASGEWSAPLRVTAVHPDAEVAQRLAALDGHAQAGERDSTGAVVFELDTDKASTPPATLSYSSLSSYGRCPYRWYLEKVLRLSDRPRAVRAAGEKARARGQAAHALLERASFSPSAPPPSREEALSAARAAGYEAGDEEVDELIGLVAAASASPIAGRLEDSSRELSFSVLLGDGEGAPLLTGVIDALVLPPDGPALVVDYKTDRLRPGQDLEDGAEERYGIQRAAYALAVLESGQCEEVEVVHLFLERPDEPVVARYSIDQLPELRNLLLSAAAGLVADEFPPSDDPWEGLCGDCPGRGGLCPVPSELTDRKSPA